MADEKFDFNPIVADIERVKALKAKTVKKPSTSIKPLKFEPSPNDSPLKAEIIKQINARDLTYSDIYNYCTKIKNGDIAEGQKLGYNTITGLKKRPSMLDTTFSMLCDFLDLDIALIARHPSDNDEDDDNE